MMTTTVEQLVAAFDVNQAQAHLIRGRENLFATLREHGHKLPPLQVAEIEAIGAEVEALRERLHRLHGALVGIEVE